MAKKFSTLLEQMSPAAQRRVKNRVELLLTEMGLPELREARKLSQENLANVLHVQQAAISKLERRTDMYISSLRSYVKAMGGDIEIVARFADGRRILIDQFQELESNTIRKTAHNRVKTA